MQAAKENRVVFVKDILRAVAVMHIPIENRHTPNAIAPLRVARRHRDVAEAASDQVDDLTLSRRQLRQRRREAVPAGERGEPGPPGRTFETKDACLMPPA